MTKNQLSFVSLFSGCGGFDLGFIQAGYNCINAYDIDPIAIATHCLNLKSGAVLRDLTSEIDHITSYNELDVLIAGPPCQGFSTAGMRRIDDPRNNLLLKAGEIATKLNPKAFIIENVRGVVAGDHKKYWDGLKALLHASGYKTHDFLISVSKLGLAQIRNRMLMIAWRTNKDLSIDEPCYKNKTLRDVIKNINGLPNHNKTYLDPNSELYSIAINIGPGQKLSNVRGGKCAVHTWEIEDIFGVVTDSEKEVLESILRLRRRIRTRSIGDADPVLTENIDNYIGRSCITDVMSLVKKGYLRKSENRYDMTNSFNGKFRRLCWDKISPTVDTRFTNPRYFLHPNEQRGFTAREAARIQGFPDSFVFLGTHEEQSRLIGNAVPPPLGKWLGESIKELLI